MCACEVHTLMLVGSRLTNDWWRKYFCAMTSRSAEIHAGVGRGFGKI